MGWNWVHLVRGSQFGILYQPQMTDNDECGKVSGKRIGKGSTQKKPAPVLFCWPQISCDFTWDRTQAARVGSWQLTAWAVT
jgi:hypothetical protein